MYGIKKTNRGRVITDIIILPSGDIEEIEIDLYHTEEEAIDAVDTLMNGTGKKGSGLNPHGDAIYLGEEAE